MTSINQIPQELQDRIDAYLLNRMGTIEKEAFDMELVADADLRREVKVQKEIYRSIEVGALKEVLYNIDDRHRHEVSTAADAQPRRYWWAIAAGFTALFALGAWILFKPTPPNQKLFSEYVQTDPGLPVPMSTVSSYRFADAMVDYKNEMFNRAIDKWEMQLKESPKNDTLQYYIASGHFSAGRYLTAIPYYEQVANNNDSHFRAKSQFYLTLSWLQTEDYNRIHDMAKSCDSLYRKNIEDISHKLDRK